MLDYNHKPKFHEKLNALIDAGIQARRAAEPPRAYLGASRLGVACTRALQFEYANAPRDEQGCFSAQTLRTFDIGHALETLAHRWLTDAGFTIHRTIKGEAIGFVHGQIRGHIDGLVTEGPDIMRYPAIWECKTMNNKNWRETAVAGVAVAKPVYAVQIAVYQMRLDYSFTGLAANPALFTAINKDTSMLHHELVPFAEGIAQQAMDRGRMIIDATRTGELLPRIAAKPDHFECRMCAWTQRCWRQNG